MMLSNRKTGEKFHYEVFISWEEVLSSLSTTMDPSCRVLSLYIKVHRCLNFYNLHKGTEWKRTWFMFPAMYWNSMENCRKYLDDVKSMLAIKEPMEWGKVTVRQIHALGGGTLLTLYKGSLFRCLQSVYKGWSLLAFLNRFPRNRMEKGMVPSCSSLCEITLEYSRKLC